MYSMSRVAHRISFLLIFDARVFFLFSTGPDKGGFYHENFLRDVPDLAKKIHRVKRKGGQNNRHSKDTEPDFYAMPVVIEEAVPKTATEDFNGIVEPDEKGPIEMNSSRCETQGKALEETSLHTPDALSFSDTPNQFKSELDISIDDMRELLAPMISDTTGSTTPSTDDSHNSKVCMSQLEWCQQQQIRMHNQEIAWLRDSLECAMGNLRQLEARRQGKQEQQEQQWLHWESHSQDINQLQIEDLVRQQQQLQLQMQANMQPLRQDILR